MERKIFCGGMVVSGEGARRADILVEGEKILAVGSRLDPEGAERVDVSGKYVFPGFLDAHTHLDLAVSGAVTADGFDSGTRAQLSGGTTCIIDFATQERGERLAEALEHWHKKAKGKAHCDYAFHLAISDWSPQICQEIEDVVAAGIRSFKLYTTYDSMVMDDKSIYEVLVRLKELGGIAGVHCENKGIIDARLEQLLQKKGHRREVSDYPATRPALAEAEAVSRILKIAACVDTPVVIVHLSSKEGYEEICHARSRGQAVYVETCPQYLLLDESRYRLPGNEGRAYMVAPPLRTLQDQEVLWKALAEGKIQTIATDHCSFTKAQKDMGRDDFSKTPCGMPGAEERPALMYHFGVREQKISIGQMCSYLAENPAKLYHLYPKKGVIAPGSDADLVVWNPDKVWTLSAKTQQSAADYCPMEGTEITGKAEMVFLRGTLAAQDGKVTHAYAGQYLTAERPITHSLAR